MQLLKYLLANGSMEYKSAKEEKGILAGDERELEEPLLANLLHGKVNKVWTSQMLTLRVPAYLWILA